MDTVYTPPTFGNRKGVEIQNLGSRIQNGLHVEVDHLISQDVIGSSEWCGERWLLVEEMSDGIACDCC